MKKKTKKIVIGIVVGLVAVNVASLAIAGYTWGWGPFAGLHDKKVAHYPGNAEAYDLEKVATKTGSPLQGKKVLYLGSSVTYGAASQQVSFADYISKETGSVMVKEAVSGTTLVDDNEKSYVSRLKNVTDTGFDLVVCQLSTNDASQKKPLGVVTDVSQKSGFDTKTVAGALEFIIAYAEETWDGCQVVFYTSPKYESAEYAQMVELLKEVEHKWHTPIIDMWDNDEFNQITEAQRALYMADHIHPTKAGYLEWWTPFMERELETIVSVET